MFPPPHIFLYFTRLETHDINQETLENSCFVIHGWGFCTVFETNNLFPLARLLKALFTSEVFSKALKIIIK